MERITLFCRGIRSGKTTELSGWLHGRKDVAGVLTPDIDELRVLKNIRTGEIFPLQTTDPTDGVTTIGRFRFLNSGFEKAREILLEELAQKPEWLVIDEVGKLEMEKNQGLEPVISQVLAHYQKPGDEKLLVLVRDFLLDDFLSHYAIFRCKVVTTLEGL